MLEFPTKKLYFCYVFRNKPKYIYYCHIECSLKLLDAERDQG